ncbi:hypothetical protein ABZP36_030131 [Zizania latifolia]
MGRAAGLVLLGRAIEGEKQRRGSRAVGWRRRSGRQRHYCRRQDGTTMHWFRVGVIQGSKVSDRIINAFFQHEHRHPEVAVHPFTTISPYSSMHDEVCCLAVERWTSLILHY